MIEEISEKQKPEGWPANAIECQLENIQYQVKKFKLNPNYKNKEVLISLICNYDLNQQSTIGLCRTTNYEVAIINSLFIEANFLQLNSLKTYLYELVGFKTRMQKMLSWIPNVRETLDVKQFSSLFHSLKLYYLSYQKFTVEKNKSFSEQLIEVVESIISLKYDDTEYEEIVDNVTHAYISLINDISYFRCKKRTKIWAFTRSEIYSLYRLAAKLIKQCNDNPLKRPLKGVLMTSISNYILKSRNNYNEDYICKYVSSNVAKESIKNHEIWISPIEKLNDSREQKIIPELLKNVEWCKYSWIKEMDLSPTRIYYVSSFCKNLNNKEMQKKYGECIYGYKDDRMAEVLSPIMNYKNNKAIPMFTQVIAFDVLYDIKKAKSELNFLCKIINLFNIDNNQKQLFLEEIMQYWMLSVKDPVWSYEKERRYVLFMYDNYEYNETDFTDQNFFKLKSSIFIEPDFILGKNPVKKYISCMVDNKRMSIYSKPYMYCYNCLNRDFDVVTHNVKKCPICNSTNIIIENYDK